MMVIMALVTTAATAPVLQWLAPSCALNRAENPLPETARIADASV